MGERQTLESARQTLAGTCPQSQRGRAGGNYVQGDSAATDPIPFPFEPSSPSRNVLHLVEKEDSPAVPPRRLSGLNPDAFPETR